MKPFIQLLLVATVGLFIDPAGFAYSQNIQQQREAKVAADVKKMRTDDYWIYNDLTKARQIATDAKKPLMIVFR